MYGGFVPVAGVYPSNGMYPVYAPPDPPPLLELLEEPELEPPELDPLLLAEEPESEPSPLLASLWAPEAPATTTDAAIVSEHTRTCRLVFISSSYARYQCDEVCRA